MANVFKIISKRWKAVVLFGLFFSFASLTITIFFPLQYRSDAQVLIISKSRYGVDPYTVVKSAERVGENIVQVAKTNDFYKKVRSQENYSIDWSRFDVLNERKKRKLWRKTLSTSVIYGTGVLNMSAYHQDPDQALYIVAAASDALVKKGWEYVGGDVTMKVVNNPVVSKWPVRPNIIINAFLGFIIGVLFGSILVLRWSWKKW